MIARFCVVKRRSLTFVSAVVLFSRFSSTRWICRGERIIWKYGQLTSPSDYIIYLQHNDKTRRCSYTLFLIVDSDLHNKKKSVKYESFSPLVLIILCKYALAGILSPLRVRTYRYRLYNIIYSSELNIYFFLFIESDNNSPMISYSTGFLLLP